MAPSRGKGKSRATPAKRTPRGPQNGVPGVYRELLAEAAATDDTMSEASERPLKKRRVAGGVAVAKAQDLASESGKRQATAPSSSGKSGSTKRSLQTVEDSSPSSEDEDETDFGFEDVDLEHPSSPAAADEEATDEDGIADISISLDTSTAKATSHGTANRRKPASVAEKSFRLLVHKLHLLCLLGHCMYVNSWCNNEVVQRHLRPLLSKRTLSYLHPKWEDSQFQRNRSFMDGLVQASEAWRGVFRVSASGMRRARWAAETDGESKDETDPLDLADFISSAKNLEGRQDCGNQLFCALLRSAGVEARLVCSLQPLPFTNVSVKPSTPQKLTKPTVYAMASGIYTATISNSAAEDSTVRDSGTIGSVPSARRRLGQPSFPAEPAAAAATLTPIKRKSVRKLAYPIFWTEAFNPAHQKWIPLDPLVTQTVNKPSKIEPPASYSDWNQLTYVFGFEADGVARDVTRRYAKAYNAKTRRLRVEAAFPDGKGWLKKAMRLFRRRRGGEGEDRDAIEDAELAQREAREGLPGNVLDFKDHPYYALERHLRRNEVIHPRREVGKVNAGTAAKPRMEAVFRRSDVVACKSADKWFRSGREVVEGEQPLKRVVARRTGRKQDDAEDEEEKTMTPLYAPFQTTLYTPPPVTKEGRVPRNNFGNLDIYTPSMVPLGGAHIRHPLAKEAAIKVLKIDAVDAVTGFSFKGRQGAAVIEGVVVPERDAEAVWAVIEGLADGKVEEESLGRSRVALRWWKRFLTGLRIKDRVSSAYGGPAAEEEENEDVRMVEQEGGNEVVGDGDFLPEGGMGEEEALPTAGRFSLAELRENGRWGGKQRKRKGGRQDSEDEEEEEEEVASEVESHGDEGSYDRGRRPRRAARRVVDDDEESEEEDAHVDDDVASEPLPEGDEDGGGFLPEGDVDDNDKGGGFLPEGDAGNDEGGGGFVAELDESRGGVVAKDMEMDYGQDEKSGGGFLVETENRRVLVDGPNDRSMADGKGNSVPAQHQSPTVCEQDVGPPVGDFGGLDGTTLEAPDDTELQVDRTLNGKLEALQDDSRSVADDYHSMNGELEDTTKGVRTTALESNHEARDSGMPNDQVDDEQSDLGSMLSHDPDDDDAEPDWLESD